ncbi:unnamed protein product [Arabidopsis lyrata]|uniref:lysine--tRNA ligase, cytoplasmic-like n=1 Tax=Arabidopsis lyrata subsp. lyrata TaxID=81972 RepID=UPI000A29DBE1|nr:lysine--tRNA ligase, cytoplasmic-like [Arabidopsis lyrata subsp. lyrata]CAH8255998.1 unnamed protein product [Arabidopsis lyrata]|eukprot:XP_020890694.1 lysine--tRNA ligase, cytoplasmic-like [Arabidopsis lyrata subsp. lyrata]
MGSTQKEKRKALISRKSSLLEDRLKAVAAGENQYAHTFSVEMSIPDFIKRGYCVGPETSLAGRIMNKRKSSSKLLFYDLHGQGSKVQIMANASESTLSFDDFSKLHSRVKHGDIVGIIGIPTKTKKGELMILSREFSLLSYCLYANTSEYENQKRRVDDFITRVQSSM